MKTFAKYAAIAAFALLPTAALADSAISELGSAQFVSIQTVAGWSDNPLVSASGRVMERVDLDSLHARIAQNDPVARQLEAYGVNIDDVIGITGSSESDITLYVRG